MSGPNMPKSVFGMPVVLPLTRLLSSWTWRTIVLFTTYSRILLGTFSSDIALKLLQLVSSSFLCSGVSLAVFQLVSTILFLMQSRNRQSIDRLSCRPLVNTILFSVFLMQSRNRQNINRLSCRPLALKALEVCCPVDFFVVSAFFCPHLKTPKPQASVSRGVSFSSLIYATCPMFTTWRLG